MSFTNLRVHLVWSTKDREILIREDFRDDLHSYLGGILKKRKHTLIAAGGMEDHIHLLVIIHQSQSIADCVRDLKSNSTKWIRDHHPLLSGFAWQTKYGAFSVSQSSTDDVVKYIANQKEHHATISYQEEFQMLLKKHGISFDDRYAFE